MFYCSNRLAIKTLIVIVIATKQNKNIILNK